MDAISIAEALRITSGTNAYQQKLMSCLALSCFAFSSFLFNLPFLLLDSPSAKNITNEFFLFEENYVIRVRIKYCFLAGIPVGGLALSYISDKFGRKVVLQNLLMWEIVFLVFAAISFTPGFLIINCFLLGFIVFTGISVCFLYIFESADSGLMTFNAARLIVMIFLSYVLASEVNCFGFSWRLILLGNAGLAWVSLCLLKKNFESVEWLWYTGRKDEAESALTKIAEINGKDEIVELLESNFDSKIGVFTLRFLCLSVLWVNFWVAGLMFKQLTDDFFFDHSMDQNYLASAGIVLSSTFAMFVPLRSFLRFWTVELIAYRGWFVLLNLMSNRVFKILLFHIVPGFLSYELIILSVLTKIELKTTFKNTGLAVLSLVTGLISVFIYATLLLEQEIGLFYITIFFLILTSVFSACYLKKFYYNSLYSPLSQDSQVRD